MMNTYFFTGFLFLEEFMTDPNTLEGRLVLPEDECALSLFLGLYDDGG